MPEPTVKCPKCKTEIKLTEAMAGPLLENAQREFDRKLESIQTDISRREQDVARANVEFDKRVESASIARVSEEVSRQKEKILGQAKGLVAIANADADEARQQLEQVNSKLTEAQQAQAAAVRVQREFETAKRELELEVEKRATQLAQAGVEQAQRRADEQYSLSLAEKERTIAKISGDLAEMQRKALEGSQKAQGEVLELNFEANLRQNFPEDGITPIADRLGQGDIHQQVRLHGKDRGLLLWELKRTKLWNDDWLPKLRGIQREVKAAIPIVCSQALPEGVETFEMIDGVWVCAPRYALAVASMLRHWLIDVDRVRAGNEGQKTKAEIVYQYMTGAAFRHRVEAVIEPFQIMREDLDSEQRATTKMWAKRGAQLDQVLASLAGLYGDLQGIAGGQLSELPALSLGPEQGKL